MGPVERVGDLRAWLETLTPTCPLLKLAWDAEFGDRDSPVGESVDLLAVAEASFRSLRPENA
jgi:hypothetical protein